MITTLFANPVVEEYRRQLWKLTYGLLERERWNDDDRSTILEINGTVGQQGWWGDSGKLQPRLLDLCCEVAKLIEGTDDVAIAGLSERINGFEHEDTR
jgi:hypothetical protein